MGHALLRTTFESEHEHQPLSRDGRIWIVGDVRIDGRAELVPKFEPARREQLKNASDIELVLAAFEEWGSDCVQNLIGDFSFVIWDRPRQQLFSARDHFGVKPFYYARVGQSLVISNMLNSIRQHPDVSSALNDAAIGDFMLVGYNAEPTTTTFADIYRLPPAHTLTCAQEVIHTARYWTLPTDGHIRYKHSADYVEHFRELFFAAVGDRLRAEQVVVPMSGGMDSTSVAAVAHHHLTAGGNRSGVHAMTSVYEHAFQDPEEAFARLVAESLGISVQFLAGEDARLFEQWQEADYRPPEPWNEPLPGGVTDIRAAKVTGRVLLSGLGGDPLLFPSSAYWVGLLKSKQIPRLTFDLVSFILNKRTVPPLYLRSALRGAQTHRVGIPFPAWVNAEFEARVGLRERWEELDVVPDFRHSHREAYHFLLSAYWPGVFFERGHPGAARRPVETRYPFFDLRLVNFVLAIPPFPWCTGKLILREAMRGILPEAVRRRAKAPLAGDPLRWRLNRDGTGWQEILFAVPTMARYVDCDRVVLALNGLMEERAQNTLIMSLRPFSLAYWIKQQDRHYS